MGGVPRRRRPFLAGLKPAFLKNLLSLKRLPCVCVCVCMVYIRERETEREMHVLLVREDVLLVREDIVSLKRWPFVLLYSVYQY